MDLIEDFEEHNWEYQEVRNEARNDLVNSIFDLLNVKVDYD